MRLSRYFFLFLLACRDVGTPEPVRLHALVAFPPKDTVRFDLPVSARPCVGGSSLLLESLSPEGNGVLLQLRFGDSLTSDSFPIVPPTDTTRVPGASVAIRFLLHDSPRGYTLDSGSVQVTRGPADTIVARAEGIGVESAIRIPARLEYQAVPIGTDTTRCGYQP